MASSGAFDPDALNMLVLFMPQTCAVSQASRPSIRGETLVVTGCSLEISRPFSLSLSPSSSSIFVCASAKGCKFISSFTYFKELDAKYICAIFCRLDFQHWCKAPLVHIVQIEPKSRPYPAWTWTASESVYPSPQPFARRLMKLYELWLCRYECTINCGLFSWLLLSFSFSFSFSLLLLVPSRM